MKAQSPESENTLAIRWVQAGVGAGLATCVVYPLVTMAPLPRVLLVVLASTLGPSLAVASGPSQFSGSTRNRWLPISARCSTYSLACCSRRCCLSNSRFVCGPRAKRRPSKSRVCGSGWTSPGTCTSDLVPAASRSRCASPTIRQGHGIHRSRPRRRSAWIESHHLSIPPAEAGLWTSVRRSGSGTWVRRSSCGAPCRG